MLTVKVPKYANLMERVYIVNELLGSFIGVDIRVEAKPNIKNYIIEYKNSKIIIKDAFWLKFKEPMEYLNIQNLPEPKNVDINFSPYNIVVLYGDPYLKSISDGFEVGFDIFASAFFMLTRWEEYVSPCRDVHGRFPGKESIAYKFGFLHRPIVNEYAEFLWNLLLKMGFPEKLRRKREYKVMLTHDVDIVSLRSSLYAYIKSTLGDLLKRKNTKMFFEKIKMYISGDDPYDTFDKIMNISEKHNTKSYFFFLKSCKKTKNDFNNKPQEIKKAALRIKSREHNIGFHPSYNTYNNEQLFICEKKLLEEITDIKMEYGRQHFLRFEVPNTWRIWENAGMKWDSTLSYADIVGFRAGSCYEYYPFDFLKRRKMNLLEIPLTIMEVTLLVYQKVSYTEYLDTIRYYADTVRKYGGTFVYLWHNTSFWIFNKNDMLYEQSLKMLF